MVGAVESVGVVVLRGDLPTPGDPADVDELPQLRRCAVVLGLLPQLADPAGRATQAVLPAEARTFAPGARMGGMTLTVDDQGSADPVGRRRVRSDRPPPWRHDREEPVLRRKRLTDPTAPTRSRPPTDIPVWAA